MGKRREAGLRRLRAAASAPWFLLAWFSWALAGSVRQYSGACLQPIPPRGPAGRQPKDRPGSQEAAWSRASLQGWEASPWPLSLPPGPHAALSASWGPPGAGFPPTLGFWRFQSLCFWWRFPPFLASFLRPFPLSALYPCQLPTNPQLPLPGPTQQLPEIEP